MGLLDAFKKGKSQAVVALDIGTFSVKMCRMLPVSAGKPRLLSLGMKELPPNAIIEKDIKDQEGVIYAVQSLAEIVAEGVTETVMNLAGHKVFTDRIQVKVSKKGRLGDAVMLEAEQRIPTGTAGIEVDYHSLGKTPDEKQEDVILVAARRELVEEYFYAARDAGLEPMAIDGDLFSAYNAYELNYGIPEEGVMAICNVGHALTNVTFVMDGSYYTVRDASTGTRAIWDYVQSELSLSNDDLEELVVDRFPIEDKGAYRTAIYNATEELKLGLDVAFNFIENATDGRTVDRIILCGGGGAVDNLPEAISQKMDVPVEVMNPFKELQVADGAFSGIDPSKVGPMYANVIGMGLRG